MDKILQQIVWKLTSDDAEKFLLLADIIKGRVSEKGPGGGGRNTSCSTEETKAATVGC